MISLRRRHEADVATPRTWRAYGTGDEAFGEANGDFLTRLHDALRTGGRGVRLLTVGADYSGTADTAYLQRAARDARPARSR